MGEQIEVSSIKIDSHPVQVPVGLSDLLSITWVKDRRKSDVLNGYDRQVIARDGQFVTKLTLGGVNKK